jgi:diketogulonate reductase-like aldo/keto reductase
VEVNPVCQQQKLRTYCAEKGIHVQAFSPLGGQSWNGEANAVLESEVLAEIAKARGKSVAQVVFSHNQLPLYGMLHLCICDAYSHRSTLLLLQVSLRWVYEQGVSIVVKTYNKERLRQNLELFDWELTDEDRLKISQIPQKKLQGGAFMFYPEGEFTSVDISEINFAEE